MTDGESMPFHSILFMRPEDRAGDETRPAPDCFHDLKLDQVVRFVTLARRDYDLAPFFHAPLRNLDSIADRQEIMRDLEDRAILEAVETFSRRMRAVRRHLQSAKELYYLYHRQGWLLAAAVSYCEAVQGLLRDLNRLAPASRGLRAFRGHLAGYAESSAFVGLAADAGALHRDLSGIRYSLIIKDNSVTVQRCDPETDYSAQIEATFAKFRRSAAAERVPKPPESGGMNHVEAQILERVARLYPETFRALDDFCARHTDYLDPAIVAFEREIQFYTAYLAYIEPLRAAGLKFSYPVLSDRVKEITVRGAFDLALADKLIRQNAAVVCNDVFMRDPERILVVSGPNHGGKTTFARMFGQLNYLAGLGCPVPGTEAKLFLCDRILSHFEREEDVATLRGKLEDDLVRMRSILDRATPNSIIVINEIFASTTLNDAIYLSKEIMMRISALDVPCAWVTFIDELAGANEKTVSMVATVDLRDPAIRTFKVVRKPPEGLAYASAIAAKYRVTHDWLIRRIAP